MLNKLYGTEINELKERYLETRRSADMVTYFGFGDIIGDIEEPELYTANAWGQDLYFGWSEADYLMRQKQETKKFTPCKRMQPFFRVTPEVEDETPPEQRRAGMDNDLITNLFLGEGDDFLSESMLASFNDLLTGYIPNLPGQAIVDDFYTAAAILNTEQGFCRVNLSLIGRLICARAEISELLNVLRGNDDQTNTR